MLLDVSIVHPNPDYSMLIVFENGEKKLFDMRTYLDQKPWDNLKNQNIFLRAFVHNGTIAWPGNYDIDPETLYELSVSLR